MCVLEKGVMPKRPGRGKIYLIPMVPFYRLVTVSSPPSCHFSDTSSVVHCHVACTMLIVAYIHSHDSNSFQQMCQDKQQIVLILIL